MVRLRLIKAQTRTSVSVHSFASFRRHICPRPLGWRLCRKTLNNCISHEGVATCVEMGIFKNEHLLVPAAGLGSRTLVPHGKEIWKQRNEAFRSEEHTSELQSR